MTFLALLLTAPALQAQDWRYRVRPGDTVWDLARRYVRPGVSWERLQDHNGIEDPLHLTPGSVMQFPVDWLRQGPAPARVVAVEGEVEASRSGRFDDVAQVGSGQTFGSGAALRTGPDASLTLEFADGSQLQLHGDSELHFDRLSAYGATGMVDTRLRLPRGRSASQVKKARGPASRYSIQAPGMMSSVRGTGFRVASDGTLSRSEVVEGRVRVDGSGSGTLVGAGTGTTIGEDGRPLAPVPLLPAPDISAWVTDVQRLPVSLQWPAVTDAAGYRVQASAHADFRTLLADLTTPTPDVELDLRREGPVHVRIRAIDAHGLEGFDAGTRLLIAAQPAPPFVISPQAGDRSPGPRPRLRWTGGDTSLRYRVQVDRNAAFNAPLVSETGLRGTSLRAPVDLEPGHYVWRVGAIAADGKSGPWSDPLPFEALPPGEGPGVEASAADGVLELRWREGEAGQRYRFQLARKHDFSEPVRNELVDVNTIRLEDLAAGTWYMRVRAVDDDGYEHPFGPPQSIKLGCLPCRIVAGAGAATLLLLVL